MRRILTRATQRLLERLVSERQRLVTDTEVLQEILHRYVAIDRRDAIQPAFGHVRHGNDHPVLRA